MAKTPAEKETAKATAAEKETAKAAPAGLDGIEVDDPEVVRPKELPLLIKPKDGDKWENPQQAEFAKTLNGYAYAHPEKWAQRKDVLLAQLVELEKNPELMRKLDPEFSVTPKTSGVTYNDKAHVLPQE